MTVEERPEKVWTPIRFRYHYANSSIWKDWPPNDPNLTLSLGNNIINRNTTPGWREKLARGEPCSNVYQRGEFEQLNPSLLRHTGRANTHLSLPYPLHCEYSHLGYGLGSKPSLDGANVNRDDVRDMALARLKRKLNQHSGSYNALVPLGEIRDLRRTIVDTAHSATDLLHMLLDIRKRYKNSAKWAAEAWLNWSFGIKPTLADTNQLLESIRSYIERGGHSVRLRGSAKDDWFSSIIGVPGSAGFGFQCTTDAMLYHTISYEYTGAFDVDLDAGNNYGLVEHLGFEWENVPSAAWELTPFSWLWDYFTTVGPFLEDVFETPAGELKYLTLQKRYTCDVEFRSSFSVSDPTTHSIDSSSTPTASYRYFYFDRTICNSLPHLALRFRTSDEIGKNALTKVLNLASILVSGHAPYIRK